MCLPFFHKWKVYGKVNKDINWIDTGEKEHRVYLILKCKNCGEIKRKRIK